MQAVIAEKPTKQNFNSRDLWWLLAFPAYQLIGTMRHEGSHALAVWLEGGQVLKFVFWPTWRPRFYWGYVLCSGQADWLVSAAPYIVDLLTFGIFYLVCTRMRIRQHWLWVNLAVIGLVSPLINSGYRYASRFFRDGDLTAVFAAVPPIAVHAFFLVTLTLYVVSLWRIQRAD